MSPLPNFVYPLNVCMLLQFKYKLYVFSPGLEKEWATDSNMDESQKYINWKKLNMKEYDICSSIYTEFKNK